MALTERQRQLIAQNAPDRGSRREDPVNMGLAQASTSVTMPAAASPAQGGASTMIGLDPVVRANAAITQTKKELSAIQTQIDEKEAGLDLDGAALLYNTTYAAKKRQLKEQEKELERAKAATPAGARLAELKAKQDMYAGYADLDSAAALAPEIERLKKQSEMEGYAGKAYTDNFAGQFSASMAVGRLQQEEAKAWGDYAANPTQENRERAQSMSAILERVQTDNAKTLNEDATLPWLSQSLAGYLPQFWDQTKAQVGGAATGAALAAMTPWTAPFVGKAAKAGATAATGLQSYQVMRGRAFKELLDLGVDEETARKAANDEAVISSMIEMAETGVDLFAGLGSLIKGGGKVATEAAKPAAKKLLTLLGKYGLNVGTEWLEEGSQQAVSIANRERAAQGETGKVNLGAATGDVLLDIMLGRNKEAAKEVVGAGNEGAKIAAMMGLPGMTGNVATSRAVNSDPLVTALFGKPTQQTAQETTQETPPNAAGERTAVPTGEDTTQAEKPAQGTQTQDALMAAMFEQAKENAASGTETASKYDAVQAEAIRREGKTFRNLVAGFDTKVSDFFNKWRTGRTNAGGEKLEKLYLGKLSDHVRSQVADILGYAVDERDVIVTNDDVKHIFDHHGDAQTEVQDGNIPLEQWMFDALPDIVTDPDDVSKGSMGKGKKNAGKQAVLFSKAFPGGTVVTVQFDNKGRKTMEIVTLYAKNKGATSELYAPVETDTSAVRPGRSEPAPIVNNNIPQPANSVNSAPEAQGESDHTNTVGAAETNFLTPDSRSAERVSNINSGAAAFTGREGEATGLNRADYDALFRYQTETEEQRRQYAGSLLYYLKDGERVFLGDLDPEGYQELVEYLTKAPAWNGVMTDTAMLIKQELQGRALADPMFQVPDGGLGVTQEDYTAWLQVLREHATDTGRGTQAWAAWTRRDNDHGQATELEAWENLENSNLSDEERRDVFNRVVKFDRSIEGAKTSQDLADIIMQIAEQRGTTNGLTGKQSKRLADRARKALDSMSFAELKQLAYSSSAALTTDRTPTDTGRKLKTIQILNMLSNPKTAATNLTGNTSFYGIDAMAMQGAAVLDMALSKLTGTRSVAMEGFVGSKQSRADIGKAIQRSLAEITLDVDMGGEGRYQQGSRRTFKANGAGVFNTGTAADRFAERVLSVLERNMGYAMTTTDEGYKGAARSTARATQKLVDEGKIKTKNKDYAAEQADNLAKYRTFQRDGYISDALQVVHDWLNAIPMLGIGDSGKRVGKNNQRTVHAFGVGDLVAPFTRVAGNLVSAAVDYNPAKAVQGTVEIVDAIRKAQSGDIDPAMQAKAVSDTARGLTGTAISLAAMALVKAGIIKRAEDEDDEDIAALNQSEGMTGTQINIDAAMRWVSGDGAEWQAGDTLVDVSRLEPLNFLFSFGAELADNENDGILSTVSEVAGDTASAFVSAAGDLPVMGTVAGIAKDTLVYGDDLPTAAMENLGKTAISSVTPNIMAAAAKGLDDKQRSTYSGEGVRDVLIDTLLSRIPGARQTLPTVVNTLGEEKDNPGNLGVRLFNSMLNPIGVNEYSQSEVSQEMERVREKTGETGFYPSKSIPSELSYTDKNDKKHTATLNYEQKQKYQMARSGAQMSVSAAMLGNPLYRKADAKMQAELLEQVHKYANAHARGQVLGKDSMEKWALHSQTAQKDLGMSQTDYLYYYVKYGDVMSLGYDTTKRMVKAGLTVDQWVTMKKSVDTNGNDSVSKTETMSYIERNFPRARWRTLFDAYKGNRTWDNPY